jgi:hypothetical protein
MIRPATLPISIITRSDFDMAIRVYDRLGGELVDLSSYELLAELWDLKRSIKYQTFTIDETRLDEGILVISLTADQTTDLPTTGAYDIKIFIDGKEYYILKGTFSTSRGYSDD